MADDEQQTEQEQVPQRGQGAEQAKALGAMSQMAPEKQLDENKVHKAMLTLIQAQKADKEAQLKREKELAAVAINAGDVDVLVAEFEVDKRAAERRLRESGGSLYKALESYL